MRTIFILGMATLLCANSYESYVMQLKNDPSMQMLEHQRHAYKEAARQASALDDPQLIIGIDNMPVEDPAFDRYLPTSKIVGFNQKFANGRDEAAGVSEAEADKRELQGRYRLQQLEAAFYSALVTHRLKQQQVENLNHQMKLLGAIQEEINNRLYSGKDMSAELSRVDERKLDIESKTLVVHSDLMSAKHVLKRLVNEVPDIEVPHKLLKSWDAQKLYPVVLAKSDEQTASAKRELAKAKDGVDFALQLLYKQREAGPNFDGEDWMSVRGTMTIPLWGKREAAYTAAMQHQHAATQDVELQKRIWIQRFEDYQVRYTQLTKRVELIRKRIDAISKTAKAQEDRYDVGHGRYIDVLESKLRILQAKYTLDQLQANLLTLAAEQNSHIME